MPDAGQVDDPLATNSQRLLTVVGAAASSVGVIGFVTVVGGAVLWIRFNAVSVPADKAVAAIPTSELLSVGLSTLIPFIALGLGTVVLAYLFAPDNVVPTTGPDLRAQWQGESAPPVAPTAPGLSPAHAALSGLAQEALSAAGAVATEAAMAEAAARIGSEDLAKQHHEQAGKALEKLQQLLPLAEGSLSDASTALNDPSIAPARLLEDAKALHQRAEKAPEEARRRRIGVRTRIVGASLILVFLEMVLVVVSQTPSAGYVILLVGLGFALAGVTILVGWRTRGFALFGASIFIAVLLFGTVRTLVRTQDSPKLQPMALLRSGSDRGILGYYITETSDRVYLARVAPEQVLSGQSFAQSLPRIVIVPRSSVVAMAIGPLMEREAGLTEATQLLQELCGEKVPETKSPHTPKSPCPPS